MFVHSKSNLRKLILYFNPLFFAENSIDCFIHFFFSTDKPWGRVAIWPLKGPNFKQFARNKMIWPFSPFFRFLWKNIFLAYFVKITTKHITFYNIPNILWKIGLFKNVLSPNLAFLFFGTWQPCPEGNYLSKENITKFFFFSFFCTLQ